MRVPYAQGIRHDVWRDHRVYFYRAGEPRHWMSFVTGGGNTPDDGWMNTSCAGYGADECTALDAIEW